MKIPRLRWIVAFTLFLLIVYRLGFYMPQPGIDQAEMDRAIKSAATSSAVKSLADGDASLRSA